MSPRVWNDHVVYILGAGYSADAGIPVIAGFLSKMRDALDWLGGQGDRKRERDAIERVLEFRLSAAAAAYRARIDVENIEELFSLASALETQTLEADVRMAIAATLDFAQLAPSLAPTKLRISLPRGSMATPRYWGVDGGVTNSVSDNFHVDTYDLCAAVMSGMICKRHADSRRTIISLNYDLVVESAMRRIGQRFNYGLDPSFANAAQGVSRDCIAADPNSTSILKLHGSMNWAQLAAFTVFDGYDGVRALGLPPAIVPPSWRKTFVMQMNHVWGAAVRSISEASHIAILGFSIPRADSHFQYLLAAGLKDNISLRHVDLVNTDATGLVDRRLFSIIRKELQRRGVVRRMSPDLTARRYILGYAGHPPAGQAFLDGVAIEVA